MEKVKASNLHADRIAVKASNLHADRVAVGRIGKPEVFRIVDTTSIHSTGSTDYEVTIETDASGHELLQLIVEEISLLKERRELENAKQRIDERLISINSKIKLFY